MIMIIKSMLNLSMINASLSGFETERKRKEREEHEEQERAGRWERLIALDKAHKESIKLARHIARQDYLDNLNDNIP